MLLKKIMGTCTQQKFSTVTKERKIQIPPKLMFKSIKKTKKNKKKLFFLLLRKQLASEKKKNTQSSLENVRMSI